MSIILDAPNFTTSVEPIQTFSIAPLDATEFNWVVTPDKPGTYSVVVSIITSEDFPELIASKNVGISVTNIIGLQASHISLISIVSTAFGPILTVPFWLEKYQKRKKKHSKIEGKADKV
ncbi:MAG: hypothetical protein AB4050_19115 [Synechococcus sp.]